MSARNREFDVAGGRRSLTLRKILANQAAAVIAAAALLSGAAVQPVVAAAPFHTNVIGVHGLTTPPTTSQCVTLFGIHCYSPGPVREGVRPRAAAPLRDRRARRDDRDRRLVRLADDRQRPARVRPDLRVSAGGIPAIRRSPDPS